MGYDFTSGRKGAPEGGSGRGVKAGRSAGAHCAHALLPALTPRGRAGGVATTRADKTPRPTCDGAIFAPCKNRDGAFPRPTNLYIIRNRVCCLTTPNPEQIAMLKTSSKDFKICLFHFVN